MEDLLRSIKPPLVYSKSRDYHWCL